MKVMPYVASPVKPLLRVVEPLVVLKMSESPDWGALPLVQLPGVLQLVPVVLGFQVSVPAKAGWMADKMKDAVMMVGQINFVKRLGVVVFIYLT